MKKKKLIIIIISIILALVLSWIFIFRKKEQPIVLETEKPTHGPVHQNVTATGTIQPVDTISVGTQVSGTIKSLYVDFNSTVKKGQLLAELDKSLFQAQVDQSQASLESARSQLIYQKNNFERQHLLYEEGAISKADYDRVVYEYRSAQANVNNIEAQLRSAKQNLAFTEIYSPIDGVILGRNVSVGQTVAASFNTPTLFVIANDITKMQVQANVDEADIGNVQKGQRASFTVDAYIDDVFEGEVREIRLQPSVSSNVVTYTTIINAANDDEKLKPGMTATVIVYTKEAENALLIPAKALKFKPDSSLVSQYTMKSLFPPGGRRLQAGKQPDAGGKNKDNDTSAVQSRRKVMGGGSRDKDVAFVWVKEGDTLVQKKIRTGINDNTQVQVLEGLSENDEVVTGIPEFSEEAATGSSRNPFLPKPGRRGGGG